MGFENVWFSRKNPKDKPNGQSKAISGKGTRECRFVSCADYLNKYVGVHASKVSVTGRKE